MQALLELRAPPQGRRSRRDHGGVLGAPRRPRGRAGRRRAPRRRRCSSRPRPTRSTSSAATRACGRPTSTASSPTSPTRCGLPARACCCSAATTSGPNCWQDEPSEVAHGQVGDAGGASTSRGLPQDPSGLLDGLRRRRRAAARRRSWPRAPRVCALACETAVARGRRRAAGLRDRHRGAGAGRRARRPGRAGGDAPAAARRHHRRAPRGVPRRAACDAAWQRVIGLVVQPGVEFDHHKVVDYVRAEGARAVSAFIEREPGMVFEAHSTDYQTPQALAAGARPLRDPQGRPRRHLRAARDAVGAWPRSSASGWATARRRLQAAVLGAMRAASRATGRSTTPSRAPRRSTCSTA